MAGQPVRNATQHYVAWPGTNEVTMTYNNQNRLTAASIFVTDGMTGQVFFCIGVDQPTTERVYVAPDPVHPEVVPTAGGVVETFNGAVGMRWSEAIPTFDTAADGVSFGWGFSNTFPV